MKTKTLLLLFITGLFTTAIIAQSPEKDIRNLLGKDPSISQNFINNAVKVGHFLNCDPWDDSKPCTDICDPWSDDPCFKQIKNLKTKKAQQQQLVRIMKNFEKVLLKGAGGKIIPKQKVLTTQKKYPGYKIGAMRNRFNAYMFLETSSEAQTVIKN